MLGGTAGVAVLKLLMQKWAKCKRPLRGQVDRRIETWPLEPRLEFEH